MVLTNTPALFCRCRIPPELPLSAFRLQRNSDRNQQVPGSAPQKAYRSVLQLAVCTVLAGDRHASRIYCVGSLGAVPVHNAQPLSIASLCSIGIAVLSAFGCTEASTLPVDPANPPEDVAEPGLISPREFIALTSTEYNNTIADLLALPRNGRQWPTAPPLAEQLNPSQGEALGLFLSPPPEVPPWPFMFPQETGVDGFESMVEGQAPSPYGIEQYQKAALHFAPWVLVSGIFWACNDVTALEQEQAKACGRESLARFAQRAWRRPLDAVELVRLQSLFDTLALDLSVEEAAVLAVTGVLQAPAFLYRIEHGVPDTDNAGTFRLSEWELASRLSYFLWDTMPDPELFQAAATGVLFTPDGIETQARRMLADPKARDAIIHFHHQWLETESVLTIAPARRMYGPFFGLDSTPALDTTDDGAWPSLINPLRQSLYAETEAFIAHIIFDGPGTLQALLSSTEGFMSSHTASIYGDAVTDRPGEPITVSFGQVVGLSSNSSLQLTPVNWPAAERAGLLTLPSILAIGAHPVHGAPILRGKRIVERIACLHFGAPPPRGRSVGTARYDRREYNQPRTYTCCNIQCDVQRMP